MTNKPNMTRNNQTTESNKTSTVATTPNLQIHVNLQKRIVLIINHLHHKTQETTGKKPAKPEMNNNPNMKRNNHIHPHPYNPHPENQINQMNQWVKQSPTGKCLHTGKVNSIDNQ